MALLAICVAAVLLLPNAWWTAATVPVLVLAGWEWARLARLEGAGRLVFLALLSAPALFVIAGGEAPRPGEVAFYGAACAFWLLVVPLWLVRRWPARSPAVLVPTGWVVLVPAWLAVARLQSDPERLLLILGVVWLSDTAAYLTGRRWGRHKLAPAVSPGKTWEGLAGAAVAVAVYYVLIAHAVPGWAPRAGWNGALLVGCVAAMGVVGDLFESWVKRQAAVKDSGTLLPGHGGVLDRIDSLTAALPAAALLLAVAA